MNKLPNFMVDPLYNLMSIFNKKQKQIGRNNENNLKSNPTNNNQDNNNSHRSANPQNKLNNWTRYK